MRVSTIFRCISNFYFYYNINESSLSCIYLLLSPYVQFAFKMAISFVVGGFLAYGITLEDELNLGYFIPKMSIVCIQQTFGLTLFTCYNMLLTLVPLSIFLFIV